jgi:hypothetical protein
LYFNFPQKPSKITFFLDICQKPKPMKKIAAIVLCTIVLISCNEKKSATNLEITGNVAGLNKGTLYIKHMVDTLLVTLDSIQIDGDSRFTSNIDIQSPEMMYLFLDRGVTNSLDNSIPFFAEAGKINIDTELEYFYAKAKVTGSQNHETYMEFMEINKKFTEQQLLLTQSKFNAIRLKNMVKYDSIGVAQDNFLKRKYLYTVNFVINNKDKEAAPYIALREINNINFKYLDTIKKSLTPKVVKSLYGKKFIDFYNARSKEEAEVIKKQ